MHASSFGGGRGEGEGARRRALDEQSYMYVREAICMIHESRFFSENMKLERNKNGKGHTSRTQDILSE